MPDAPVVVVGASVAGVNAVEAIRASGYRGKLVVIEREKHALYDRPPLSKEFLVADVPATRYIQTLDEVTQRLDCDVRQGRAALALDVEGHRVRTGGGWLRYSRLVLACGLDNRPLQLAGKPIDLYPLRSLHDAERLRAALHARPRRLVVVGAGLIGSEVASAARRLGVPTCLVGRARAPMAKSVGPTAASMIMDWHRSHGVGIRLGVLPVEAGATGVTLSDGSSEEADLVAFGVGGQPATDWLRGSGVVLDDAGAIVCDETLQAAPDVYAAGDAASWPSARFERRLRREHWTTAAEMGALAGSNAGAGTAAIFDTVPYMWADLYGNRVQVVGVVDGASERQLVNDPVAARTLTLFERDGHLVAATGVGLRRVIARLRRAIRERQPIDDAADDAVAMAETTAEAG